MRTVYATQFRIRPQTGQTTSQLIEAVVDRVWFWLGDRYSVDGAKLVPSFDGTPLTPRDGHKIVSIAEVIDGNAVVTVEWTYPHEPDPTVLWLAHIVIAASNEEVEMAVSIRISSVGFILKPLDYVLRRPKLLLDLFKRFTCTAGNTLLSPSPTIVEASDIPDFVEHTLRSPKRTLPAVVVSPVVWDNNFLVDAGQLQDELAGLAVVAELESKWAGFALSEVVGPTFACYNGAVRVYWPGFKGVPDDNLQHFLYLPVAIEKLTSKSYSLARHLFKQFSALAAFRHTDGEIISLARHALDQDRRSRMDSLIERSKSSPTNQVDSELLQLALSENERLEREARQHKERLSELEVELATAKVNFAAMAQAAQGEAEGVQAADDLVDQSIDTVSAALQQVAQRNAERVAVLKSAFDAAEGSDFARPDDVLKGLLVIIEIGQKYFENKGKRSIGRLEELFEQHGLKYAPTESQNTLNMYGDTRRFLKDGLRKQMLKHITIGKGDTKNCLQIYFDFNDETKQIEIGYCGRHLPYFGQRT